MNVAIYKCTSDKINGEIVLIYHDERLFNLNFKLTTPLTTLQIDAIKKALPFSEKELSASGFCGLKIENTTAPVQSPVINNPDVPPLKSNEKIALFMDAYANNSNGLKYRITEREAGMIKNYDVTIELLKTYFSSNSVLFKDKYSISNYCKFYNELCREAYSTIGSSKFPKKYDRDYEAKLTGKELSEYWKHLRGLGLTPKKDRQGRTTNWL